jgi:hypothetical protein
MKLSYFYILEDVQQLRAIILGKVGCVKNYFTYLFSDLFFLILYALYQFNIQQSLFKPVRERLK